MKWFQQMHITYGGYRQKKVKSTGFFRIEKIDGRWWFVDPEGFLFLSVGVDGVVPGRDHR